MSKVHRFEIIVGIEERQALQIRKVISVQLGILSLDLNQFERADRRCSGEHSVSRTMWWVVEQIESGYQ